ncbi:MAG: type II toxin-antitoxin system death-on-curing family toxin [Proteobacteria bacterium]|nr:type II toxin-antitoxin system death-on-curing family toxin [Pseudomonadota bacterium]
MKEPGWLTMEMVRAIHEESLTLFGGAAGVRDEALLESAVAHPQSVFAYAGKPTIHHLAAAYCSGIIRNHPFIDGNKRAGLLAARAYLYLNGYDFDPDEAEEVNVIVELAAGNLGEDALGEWFKSNTARIKRR